MSIVGQDCGTTSYLTVMIKEPNNYKFRNVKLPSERTFQPLSYDLYDKYRGKVVHLRSPMFCRQEHGICEKCFGDLWKYNGVRTNLSAYITALSADIMNKSMKSFHNLEAKYTKLNYKDILLGKK